MGDSTARLGLPLLAAGQAQKELWHNEALALLDMVACAGVEELGASAPPATPMPGRAWVLGADPVGAWAGHARELAGWTDGGWRFVAPFEGLSVWVVAEKLHATFTGGRWVPGEVRARRVLVDGVPVVGPQRPAIAAPAGGATVDAEARAGLEQVLAALRAHGLIAP
ncbi:DUF2793 domain-containing protein [Sphingomonas lenta]|uniref:DUF2793 domain-containing protein n=1 Tax=Sphingomonas lenta TaxID=1141887 RepID=A0A2A2SCJ1_9SPHN|nr:DUF2793 domain-containing protein [Sphingomonas lenta]PAX07014.1 hypothetical protein CKY28_13205 [Sphingomonas lenta]